MIFGEAEGCTTTRIEALNTDAPLIREDVQPCKLLEAAAALQQTALILGSPHIRCWFDEALLARTQSDMLQIQDAVLAKLQRLHTRALEALQASEEHGEGSAE
nr:MAG TPA: hypothetical protein [Caudoviricetes sp.]